MSSVLAEEYNWYTYTDETAGIYYDGDGLPLQVGDIYKNPQLGATIRKIIDKGADGFYKGDVAEAIVNTCNKYGNTMTLEDLENYEVKIRVPVSGKYRGNTIISSPPSSSGGTSVIKILNILENFDVSQYEINSPEYINLFSESFKIAFADRAQYIADSDFTDVPLEGLTSKDFASKRASEINLGSAQDYLAGEPYGFQGSNTTYFSVMDKEGNIVSVTQTNNGGSGITAEGTGVLLNGEMADFSSGWDNANSIEEGKRPLSSMSPSIILDEKGEPYAAIGTPGSTRIITTMAQVISHVIDHDMDIQEAINEPRFFCNGGDLYMETRIPEAVSGVFVPRQYGSAFVFHLSAFLYCFFSLLNLRQNQAESRQHEGCDNIQHGGCYIPFHIHSQNTAGCPADLTTVPHSNPGVLCGASPHIRSESA